MKSNPPTLYTWHHQWDMATGPCPGLRSCSYPRDLRKDAWNWNLPPSTLDPIDGTWPLGHVPGLGVAPIPGTWDCSYPWYLHEDAWNCTIPPSTLDPINGTLPLGHVNRLWVAPIPETLAFGRVHEDAWNRIPLWKDIRAEITDIIALNVTSFSHKNVSLYASMSVNRMLQSL